MKIHQIITLAGMLSLYSLVQASDPGSTTRSSDLFKKPSYQADKLGTLEKGTSLSVLDRQGGWYLVETAADARQGWVRMLSIRLGSGKKKTGDSGISALSQFARSGQSGQVVATGVRGLSEENIREAKPDIKELKKMQDYQASPNEAQAFAQDNDLKSRNISYLETSKKSSNPQSNSFNFSE